MTLVEIAEAERLVAEWKPDPASCGELPVSATDEDVAREDNGAQPLCSAVGPDLADGFSNGEAYRFFGGWTTYTNKRTGQEERQFFYKTAGPAPSSSPQDRQAAAPRST